MANFFSMDNSGFLPTALSEFWRILDGGYISRRKGMWLNEAQTANVAGERRKACIDKKLIDVDAVPDIEIDMPKDAGHGDYASNVAMVLASRAKGKLPPRRIAEIILKNIRQWR